MMLSQKLRFRVGIGLVTAPAFMMGLLMGLAIALAFLTQPARAATQGSEGRTSTASVEITLVIPERKRPEEATGVSTSTGNQVENEVPTETVVKDGKIYIEPV